MIMKKLSAFLNGNGAPKYKMRDEHTEVKSYEEMRLGSIRLQLGIDFAQSGS